MLAKKGREGFFECGRHSGFPDCCITFFVDVYLPVFLVGQGEKLKPYLAQIEEAKYAPGFIPCPACLAIKRPQAVLPCDCEARLLAAKKRRRS